MILELLNSLEVALGTVGTVDYTVDFADHDVASFTLGNANGALTLAVDNLLLAGPIAGKRQVLELRLQNNGVANIAVTLKLNANGTRRNVSPPISLPPKHGLQWTRDRGVVVLDLQGREVLGQAATTITSGRVLNFMKIGTAPEQAGIMYAFGKDAGLPGAWSPGTPGVNGRSTDGLTAADAGCFALPDPVNRWFLANIDLNCTTSGYFFVADVLWVNSGLVVTTLTPQLIVMPALPPRDANGATLGDGLEAAILITAATTNAATIANISISYTNSAGVPNRTGSIPSFPATAVIGTVVPFTLQAGDAGIQSIQSITIGTSLLTGAASLILFRRIMARGVLLANTGSQPTPNLEPGVRVWNRSAMLLFQIPSGTTAGVVSGALYLMDR